MRIPDPRATLLLLMGLALGASCSDSRVRIRGEPSGAEGPIPVTVLTGGDILHQSDTLEGPTAIEVVGDWLVVLDSYADSAVKIFRKDTGDYVRALGREGDGPGEFRGPWSVLPPADSGTLFWVFDLGHRRLSRFDAARLHLQPEKEIHLLTPVTIVDPVWVSADRLVSLTFSESGRLAEFDSAGKLVRYLGEPPKGVVDAPATVLQQAYVGTLLPHPDRSRLAVATRYASQLGVLGLDGVALVQANGPVAFEPRFSIQGDRMASGDDMRFGYVDLAVTRERIYGLYSGRTRAEAPGAASLGIEIHEFDWDGVLLARHGPSGEVISIAVDVGGDFLYVLQGLPAPAILRFPLGR